MELVLTLGSLLGALCGLAHGAILYRDRMARGRTRMVAAWYALWACGLWMLFGAYLLVFWVIGAAGMALARRGARA